MKIYDKNNRIILDITVDDNSYRNRSIMADHALTLYYSLPEHVELPVGSYCEFEGLIYTLIRPEQFKMKHSRLYEYTVIFSSDQEKAKIWKFRNPVDGRLKFPLTAKPKEHLQMFVDNMNRRDTGWTVGDCIDDVEKLITYDHDYCWDALTKQATEFETEFEIVGKRVSLRKVEYNKSNPLHLSYGRGNGFKSGIGRSNSGSTPPVEILFVQGGSTNIDRSKYPADETLRATSSGCLLLPIGQTLGYDGEHFENEDGYNPVNARHYLVDDLGLSIRNIDRELSTLADDSLDRSDDYPKRVGTISRVAEVDKEKNFYDFIDSSIPLELNYEDYLIGDTMSVIFQSGMLAGREFDVKYYHEAKKGKAARRFEIVPQEIDGMTMPGEDFIPREGDTYAIFHVMLPDAYIRNDSDKSGASWDMFRAAVKYLFDNEEQKFTFTGELDGIWAKKDWINIGGKIKPGGFVRYTGEGFEQGGVLVRIIAVKDYINNPHAPKIELSNETVSGSVSSTLKRLEATEVVAEEYHRDAIQFTKRRFRDAKETIDMIQSALSDNFTNRINPVAVETMSMLVGDERLQYQFVATPGSTEAVSHNITWNAETKQLIAPVGTVQHLTLGINSIRPSHEASEYLYWNVERFESEFLEDGSAKYYLYIRAQKLFNGNVGSAVFRLETSSRKLEEDNCYWLLVGVLNTEYKGERSFVTLYGFSEILPGRISTDRIVSADGESYFDMLNSALKLKDKLQYNVDGNGKLKICGTIVQSQSGQESYIGCYRGVYNPSYTYYEGDEVTYTNGHNTSTYRYIHTTPSRGLAPTASTYWQVLAQGAAGKDGKSPVMVYRGVYDSSKTYYGNANRLDCVKVGSVYYIARIDAGTFSSPAPPDTSKWNAFGASFESVATGLLLAENANIAGWIFRNGRLESQTQTSDGNPMMYMNGEKGEARINGILQLSCAYSGNISDSNLFWLPKQNAVKTLSMGHEREDIGKVVRLYNSGKRGDAYYQIGCETFGIKPGLTDATLGSFYVRVMPGEVVELTCFRMPTKSFDIQGSWQITNRFTLEENRNTDATQGRYPRMLAMGTIKGSDVSSNMIAITGRWYDGKQLSSVFTVTRTKKGYFTVQTKGTHKLLSDYRVFCTGLNGNYKGATSNHTENGFDLMVSDDETLNNGDCEFMIMDNNWWYDYSVM